MSDETYIVAFFEAKPGKLQTVKEALHGMINNVWEKEKDTCQRYEMCQDVTNSNRLVMIETYSSKKDAKEHGETQYFKEFAARIQPEDWLVAPPIIINVQGIGGFADRQKGLI